MAFDTGRIFFYPDMPYPASIIAKKDTTYVARATLYDENGEVFKYKGQNLFLYDRPEYLGEDGIYCKNGTEMIYPTYDTM